MSPLVAKRRPSYAEDIKRIVEMPLSFRISPEEAEEVSRIVVRKHWFDKGFRLWPQQAESLLTFIQTDGRLAAPLGLGDGKTGVGLLCAAEAYQAQGHRRIMLSCPPNLVGQLVKNDIPWWRARVDLPYQVHNLHAKGPKERIKFAEQRRPGLYLVPYSLYSGLDGEELLHAVDASLVILDESHSLKDFYSARTGRFMDWVKEKDPHLLPMSGTMSDKKLQDFAHIINQALGDLSPVPLDSSLLYSWSLMLNSDAAEPDETQIHRIAPLVMWYQRHFPKVDSRPDLDGIRRAFRARFVTCPGVVPASDGNIGVSLLLDILDPAPGKDHPRTVQEDYKRLEELRRGVDELWITPDGDEISYALHKWKYLFELSAGFYYAHDWPVDANPDDLERSKRHHELKQEYNRLLRAFLQTKRRPKLDTPKWIGLSFSRFGNEKVKDLELFEAWSAFKALEAEGPLVERQRRAELICDYKMTYAASIAESWAAKGEGGILWYSHQAVGSWLSSVCLEQGLDVLFCPGGKAAADAIRDERNVNKIVVASTKAHGTGRNLQFHHNALFVQVPRKATLLNQTLGRLHRNGQERDEITQNLCMHGDWDDLQFAATLVEAVYQARVMGDRQKVIDGRWLTEPRAYPPQYLATRGLRVRNLDAAEERAYLDRFGEKFRSN